MCLPYSLLSLLRPWKKNRFIFECVCVCVKECGRCFTANIIITTKQTKKIHHSSFKKIRLQHKTHSTLLENNENWDLLKEKHITKIKQRLRLLLYIENMCILLNFVMLFYVWMLFCVTEKPNDIFFVLMCYYKQLLTKLRLFFSLLSTIGHLPLHYGLLVGWNDERQYTTKRRKTLQKWKDFPMKKCHLLVIQSK